MSRVNVEIVNVPVPRNLLFEFEDSLHPDYDQTWQEIVHIPSQAPPQQQEQTAVTLKPKRITQCSFCKCVGHNIRNCNSNLQSYLQEQIKWYLTVSDDSNYARLSNEEFARIVEMHLRTSSVANLSMFCVILNLPIEKRKADLVAVVKERITGVRFARKYLYDQQAAERRMNQIKKQMQEDMDVLLRKKEHVLQVERTASESGNRVHELLAEGMNENFRNQLVDFHNKYDFITYTKLMGQIAELELEYHATIPVKNVFVSKTDSIHTHEDEECPVCYEMITKDKICITQCSHTFCYDCVVKVIQTSEEHKCPYCREKIVELNHPICDENCPPLKGIYCIGF